MNADPNSGRGPTIFYTVENQAGVCLGYFLAITLMTFLIARRTHGLATLQWHVWSSLSWGRFLCLSVFAVSWIFLAGSGILLFGVGTSRSEGACEAGILLCIVAYTGSKLLIYLFLIERVWIIQTPNLSQPRFKSGVYRLCLVVVLPYIAVITLMAIGRISQLQDLAEGGRCYIGLTKLGTIPVLAVDSFVTVFLTAMFVYPILRSTFVNDRLRKLAIRTTIAAVAAVLTSIVNMAILLSMHGHQLSWVCLGCCGIDVLVNACVLFYVTYTNEERSLDDAVSNKHRFTDASQAIGGFGGSKVFDDETSPTEWQFGSRGISSVGGGDVELGSMPKAMVYPGRGPTMRQPVLSDSLLVPNRGKEERAWRQAGVVTKLKKKLGIDEDTRRERQVGVASLQVQVETVREVEIASPLPDPGQTTKRPAVRFTSGEASSSAGGSHRHSISDTTEAVYGLDYQASDHTAHGYTSHVDLIKALERADR